MEFAITRCNDGQKRGQRIRQIHEGKASGPDGYALPPVSEEGYFGTAVAWEQMGASGVALKSCLWATGHQLW